ncbi:MAG TPA: lipopolysaccharide biosynthesis protein [Rugosimonospora sp.]|jgi:O-antigen/teichoic acid export membrane protein
MTFYNSGNARDTPHTYSTDRRETLLEALRWMTVYESANAATPRNRLQRVVKRNGDLLSNSGALMATSVLTSLLGFVYWWVADRSFSAEAVGAASAAISAMTLVGTLGMFGMGTLLISELPKSKDGQWSLISTCVMVAAAASTVGGGIYVGLALFVPGLRSSLGSPVGIALLILAMALNGAMLVFDEGLVGLLLGHLQLVRNAYFAVGKLIVIGIVAVLPVAVTGSDILGTWVAGILLSMPLLWLSLRSRGMGSIRPRLAALRGLGRHAIDHNLLNVALFLPRTSLPLVVTSVVSTRANAAFYTAWMVMGFLAMIPGSIATTLFAVASGDVAGLRARVRIGLAVALGVGVPVSTGIAILARPIMSVFGHEYAASASGALSVLALTYVVGVVRQFYVVISRVRRRARRASVYAVLIGIMELAAAWIGGSHDGLSGLVAWLAGAFVVEGVFMAPAVIRVALARVPAPADGAASSQAAGSGESGSGGTQAPSTPVVPARPRRRPPAVLSPGEETVVIPGPRADETMVIPRARMDETMVLPRQRADETMVIPRPRIDEPVAMAGTRADDTMVIPRPRIDETVARPPVPAKETSVNPWFTADAVDLFTPVAADETAVIPRFTAGPPARRSKAAGDETTMVVRPKADETAVIPRMRPDESAQPPPRVI